MLVKLWTAIKNFIRPPLVEVIQVPTKLEFVPMTFTLSLSADDLMGGLDNAIRNVLRLKGLSQGYMRGGVNFERFSQILSVRDGKVQIVVNLTAFKSSSVTEAA